MVATCGNTLKGVVITQRLSRIVSSFHNQIHLYYFEEIFIFICREECPTLLSKWWDPNPINDDSFGVLWTRLLCHTHLLSEETLAHGGILWKEEVYRLWASGTIPTERKYEESTRAEAVLFQQEIFPVTVGHLDTLYLLDSSCLTQKDRDFQFDWYLQLSIDLNSVEASAVQYVVGSCRPPQSMLLGIIDSWSVLRSISKSVELYHSISSPLPLSSRAFLPVSFTYFVRLSPVQSLLLPCYSSCAPLVYYPS